MTNPLPDYSAVLADLERKRDELDRTIATLRAFAGIAVEGPSEPPPPAGPGGTPPKTAPAKKDAPTELRSDTFFGMKAPEAIRTYLLMSKGPRAVAEIVQALQSGGFMTSATNLYNNLYTALTRMEKNDEARKLPDGRWGLAEWYPATAKRKAAKPASTPDVVAKSGSATVAVEAKSLDEEFDDFPDIPQSVDDVDLSAYVGKKAV